MLFSCQLFKLIKQSTFRRVLALLTNLIKISKSYSHRLNVIILHILWYVFKYFAKQNKISVVCPLGVKKYQHVLGHVLKNCIAMTMAPYDHGALNIRYWQWFLWCLPFVHLLFTKHVTVVILKSFLTKKMGNILCIFVIKH